MTCTATYFYPNCEVCSKVILEIVYINIACGKGCQKIIDIVTKLLIADQWSLLVGWSAEVGIPPDYGPGNHSRQLILKLDLFS